MPLSYIFLKKLFWKEHPYFKLLILLFSFLMRKTKFPSKAYNISMKN